MYNQHGGKQLKDWWYEKKTQTIPNKINNIPAILPFEKTIQ